MSAARHSGATASDRAHNAPGRAHFSIDAGDHDAVSLVVWSLFLGLMFLLPVVGIFAIKLFE